MLRKQGHGDVSAEAECHDMGFPLVGVPSNQGRERLHCTIDCEVGIELAGGSVTRKIGHEHVVSRQVRNDLSPILISRGHSAMDEDKGRHRSDVMLAVRQYDCLSGGHGDSLTAKRESATHGLMNSLRSLPAWTGLVYAVP